MKFTRKCTGCGEEFRKDEMIEYSSLSGKTCKWYCKSCYEEKLAREKFSNKICSIFGIKAPGPRIWTERKRLQNKYGYTDDTIIECLDYIYNVLKMDKLTDSLTLVNPRSMIKMQAWKSMQAGKASSIAASIANTQTVDYLVPVQENKNSKKEINLDDALFD